VGLWDKTINIPIKFWTAAIYGSTPPNWGDLHYEQKKYHSLLVYNIYQKGTIMLQVQFGTKIYEEYMKNI